MFLCGRTHVEPALQQPGALHTAVTAAAVARLPPLETHEAIDRHDTSEANQVLIKQAAAKAAATVFADLNLDGSGKLNFLKFIHWWQSKMKVAHSQARILDNELQVCQKIWHEYDDDGSGVSVEELGAILERMLKDGAISIAPDGSVVVNKTPVHRARQLTGIDK